jgi:phenylalanyl-tRNA synthetase beta chain
MKARAFPEGKRSYAVSFILRDDAATLEDKTIEKTMERLLGKFKQELGAELRG